MTSTRFRETAPGALLHTTPASHASWRVAGALLIGLLGGGHALADGDASRGEGVFQQECAGCHSVKENRNKMGPSLFGVVGRQCGSAPDFVYSDALKQAGFTWTPAQLDSYLTKPQQAVPGVKMPYGGLGDSKARADLIAYLTTVRNQATARN